MFSAQDGQDRFTDAVGGRLIEVLRLISPNTSADRVPAPIFDALECFCSGGKRARPRLVWCVGRAVGAPHDALLDVAVAAELIHAASLLHDDVLDRALRRRSVLAGDLLLTRALGQLHHHALVLTADAIETVDAMSRSALAETRCRGRLDLGLGEWRHIAEGKTGVLFAFCGRAAARLGEANDAVMRFDAFGRHAGVAFQLADDLLDLRPDSKKDRFADIRNRELTSLLLRVAALPDLGERLERYWRTGDGDSVEELGAAICASGAPQQMLSEITEEVELAVASLGPYRGLPGCVELEDWTRMLVQRALAFSGSATGSQAEAAPGSHSGDRLCPGARRARSERA
jgi:octaprenyl-diphosphate synthase